MAPNLLQNPGFEYDFDGWFHGDDPAGARTEIDTGIAHSGSKSLRITFDDSVDNYWTVSQAFSVEANTTYRLQGFLRLSGMRAFNSIRLEVKDEQVDERGDPYFVHRTPDLYTTQDWTPVAITFTTLPDTETARLVVLRDGGYRTSGTVWVDDLSLVRLPPLVTPSELTLLVGTTKAVTVRNGRAPFVWTSSHPGVATVQPADNNTQAQITTLSPGEAGITVVDADGRAGLLTLRAIEQSVITVYADRLVREVPDAMFGSSVLYDSTSQYIPDHPVWGDVLTDPVFIADVAALGLSSLRYPGGTESNYYDFSSGRGYTTWIGGTDQFNVTNGITTDQFIQFLKDAGIPNAMMTANVYKSGNKNWPGDNWISPQIAAAWVEHINQRLGFYAEYWELGNEVTSSDEFPWNEAPQVPGLTRDLYLQKIHEWSQAMKAVDATIKIGAVALESPSKGGITEWWTLPVIQERAEDIDFLIIHPYVDVSPFMETGSLTDRTAQEAYGWIWSTTSIKNLRGLLNLYAPGRSAKIEIQASEWGVVSDPGILLGYDTLLNVVLNTDSLWDMVQEGADGANMWNLCDWPYPSMQAKSGGLKYAQYHMMWMNRRRSGKWLVESQVSSPTYSAGPFGSEETMDYVEAVDAIPYLAAYATLSEDRGHLYLIVTNKSSEPQSTAIHLNGFLPQSQASVWQMTSAHWDDTDVRPVTATISDAASTFTYNFPARSVTSFVFAIK